MNNFVLFFIFQGMQFSLLDAKIGDAIKWTIVLRIGRQHLLGRMTDDFKLYENSQNSIGSEIALVVIGFIFASKFLK